MHHITDLQSIGLAPVYDAAEMCRLYWRDYPTWLARLAALTPAQLARQAAAHIAYAQQFGSSIIDQERLLRSWQQKMARAGGNGGGVCVAIFELATTDPQALIEFLRGHTPEQRTRLAWLYTSWLRRTHGVERTPGFIAGNWAKALRSAAIAGDNGEDDYYNSDDYYSELYSDCDRPGL